MFNKAEVEPGEYEKFRNIHEELVRIAVSISDASGGIRTANANIIANQIYTRIVLCSMTLGSILPGNSINGHSLWDYPSIASLSRMLIETCHRLFYLTEKGVSEEGIQFRIDLLYYHLNLEKYKLYKEMGVPKEVLEEFERILPERLNKLVSSEIFNGLSKYKKNKIREGNCDMYLSDIEIASTLEFMHQDRYKVIYRMLSNHVHAAPFATLSQSNTRGRGFRNNAEEGYIVLMLRLVSQYLSLAICRLAYALDLVHVNPDGITMAEKISAGNF